MHNQRLPGGEVEDVVFSPIVTYEEAPPIVNRAGHGEGVDGGSPHGWGGVGGGTRRCAGRTPRWWSLGRWGVVGLGSDDLQVGYSGVGRWGEGLDERVVISGEDGGDVEPGG